jgi:hypothetical protein
MDVKERARACMKITWTEGENYKVISDLLAALEAAEKQIRIDTRAIELYVTEQIANRERLEKENERLREALRPFANYACDPPCGCHNCVAKAAASGKEE